MHVARKSENPIDFLQDVRKHPSIVGISVPVWLNSIIMPKHYGEAM